MNCEMAGATRAIQIALEIRRSKSIVSTLPVARDRHKKGSEKCVKYW